MRAVRRTAASQQRLATASSFLTSLAALYRVHLRLSLARHTYHLLDAADGAGSSASIEQSWSAIRRGMSKGPWKAADKSHKQLATVMAQLDVDSLAEWQPLQLTGALLVDTCELCLGRLDSKAKEKSVQLILSTSVGVGTNAEGNTVTLHQLCANVFTTVGLAGKA